MATRVPESARRTDRRRVAGGFVAVVAISAGLVAVRAGASLPEAAGVAGVGGLLGGLLLLILVGRS